MRLFEEGAPASNKLLIDAFNELNSNERLERIKDFLKDFYLNDCSDESLIPTFEEILSIIDISLQKREQFSDKWNYNKLTNLRDDLIYCICSVLNEKLSTENILHRELIDKLFSNEKWQNYNFISLNYDILLDNALMMLGDDNYMWNTNLADPIDLDYGIKFRNEGLDWRKPGKRKVPLLKLHGSLNWLYCPTCNSIKINPYDKRRIMNVFTNSIPCEKDLSNQNMLIIPPTWQKVYDNPYFVQIWLMGERILQKASKIFIIGYSMPESDMNVRYLMKKSLFRGNGEKHPEVIIIDKKGKDEDSDSYKRYKRLFGEINYQPIGFKNYVEKINDFL